MMQAATITAAGAHH